MQRAKTPQEAEFAFGLRNEKCNDTILMACEKEHPHLLGTKTIDEIRRIPRHGYRNELVYKNAMYFGRGL
jgi:hypothetical protein